MQRTAEERAELAKKRLRSVLRAHVVATARILEQKIADAGPLNQRIDPHVLTVARAQLEKEKVIRAEVRGNVPWYYLAASAATDVRRRLQELEPIQLATQEARFTQRVGQALEIAMYRALVAQWRGVFFGKFLDLDEHDDGSLYSKEEPPSSVSGATISGRRKLDFLLVSPDGIRAGIEVKNIREWLYPDREEVQELIGKCCEIDAVPILIGRRIPFVTFGVLSGCGVIVHQTYNQRYARADADLAAKAGDKRLLGYHDIRVGNEPDGRLLKFVGTNLPALVRRARASFVLRKGVLAQYGRGEIGYGELVIRLREG